MILENPTHLYRHLIRNAHLFRDDHARNSLSAYIRRRFEANRYEADARQREKLKAGRYGLSLIKRANAGVYAPLFKILRFTYGRIGPWRYELLKPMIAHQAKPRPPPLISGIPRTAPPPPLTAPVTSLLKWKGIRKLIPEVPETNSWGRPLAKNREANIRWRFYSKLMKEVPAPLVGPEYERLTRLAAGLEEPKLPRRKDIPKSSVDYKLGPLERPAQRSRRFWIRIYRVLLKEVPGMKYDAQHKVWKLAEPDFYVGKQQRPVGDPEEFEGAPPEKPKPLGRGMRGLKKRITAQQPYTEE